MLDRASPRSPGNCRGRRAHAGTELDEPFGEMAADKAVGPGDEHGRVLQSSAAFFDFVLMRLPVWLRSSCSLGTTFFYAKRSSATRCSDVHKQPDRPTGRRFCDDRTAGWSTIESAIALLLRLELGNQVLVRKRNLDMPSRPDRTSTHSTPTLLHFSCSPTPKLAECVGSFVSWPMAGGAP